VGKGRKIEKMKPRRKIGKKEKVSESEERK
jgi:hypothetical protein